MDAGKDKGDSNAHFVEDACVPQPEADVHHHRLALGWRTWTVVFISAYLSLFMQIFTTVAAPSTIAFIVADIGGQSESAWILQAPLLMQVVLNPIFGRLSDVLDRKMLAVVTPVIAFAGSVISAKANSVTVLIAGAVLYGVVLASISIVQAIPAEILPLKYRTVASGLGFMGGACGATAALFTAGGFCRTPGGWRNMFWVQAALQLLTSALFYIFYWPPKPNRESAKRRWIDIVWACDPIGSVLFVGGSAVTLTALNWASGTYSWSDKQVVAPLTVGLCCLIAFGLYEWKGRVDGILAHCLFQSGPNFPLTLFACTVEGWMYYSAVNAITNQMQFYLAWETDPLIIAARSMTFNGPTLLTSAFLIWYTTKYKDVKWPLVVCFTLFAVSAAAFAATKRDWGNVQLGLSALVGIGQAGPLMLLVALAQFAAPHEHLATATGVIYSARAIGGAFGAAILYTIAFGHVGRFYNDGVAHAALEAGLPPTDVAGLLGVMAEGHGPPTPQLLTSVLAKALPSATAEIIKAALDASHDVYAKGFALAWASIVPVAFLSVVCCLFLKSVREQMTDQVQAPLQEREVDAEVKAHPIERSD